MHAHLLAQTTLSPLWSLDRIPGAGCWIAHTSDGLLTVLDDGLNAVGGFQLPDGWPGGHTAAPDLSFLAVSGPDRVVVLAGDGSELWSHPHAPWGSDEAGTCQVTPDGKGLWAVVRTAEGDRCRLLDTGDGAVRRDVALPVPVVGVDLLIHPDGEQIGLAATHTDGVHRVWWLSGPGTDGSDLTELPGTDRILAAVHPFGELLLTTPATDGPLGINRQPDGAVVAACPSARVFPEPDEVFDVYAGFLTPDLVLAASSGGRHLLCSVPDLRPIVEVAYGQEPGEWLVVREDGSWLTADPETGEVRLWRLPEA